MTLDYENEEAEEPNTCGRCRACFALDECAEPSRFCHPCAQEVAGDILLLVEERKLYLGTHNHDDQKFIDAIIAAVDL